MSIFLLLLSALMAIHVLMKADAQDKLEQKNAKHEKQK